MSELEGVSISSTSVFLTPEGNKKLQRELEHLTTVKRAEIAQRLRDSMEHGEFSEDNHELDEVKFEQGLVENRISELKLIFAGAQVIEPEMLNTDSAYFGNYVTVRDPDRAFEFEIRLVSSVEADPDEDYVSVESPMGTAIFGHKVGDVVEFDAPAGRIRYEVLKIRK